MLHQLYDIEPLETWIGQGYVLLTPNYRLARRIKTQWDARCAAAGDAVWEPLQVHALEAWIQGLWERAVSLGLITPQVPISAGQAAELWRQVINEAGGQTDEFALLSAAAAAELASQARESLGQWQLDVNASAVRQSFELDHDCATFRQWLMEYDSRLAAAGLTTSVDCMVQLTQLPQPAQTTQLSQRSQVAAQEDPLYGQRVVLVACGELSPLVSTVLEKMCLEIQYLEASGAHGQRLQHACADKRTELQSVAAWAAGIHRADPTATIGVVLSDMSADRVPLEYLLRREFGCLGENYTSLPVNFSTGISLANAPLVRDALAVLGLGLQHSSVPVIMKVLQSRFINLPDASSALTRRFITRLFDGGRKVIEMAEVRTAATKVQLGDQIGLDFGQKLLAMSGLRHLKRAALPSVWVARFEEILSLWGWPGAVPLDSLEYQQMALWYQTLDELRSFDAVCRPLDYSAALTLLQACCARQISQPQTLDSKVQVLGPLEASGLEFDHLWLCGMQAANWPTPPRPNPLIPVALQTQLHMPHATAQREWQLCESRMQQYARSAQHLHASYCRQIDGVADLPSPFLQEFDDQELPEAGAVSWPWIEAFNQRSIECLDDRIAPVLDPTSAAQVGGGSGLLEDQSQCPFRAFARRRLRVEPVAEFSTALSPADRGSLLHDALYALWGDIGDHTTLLSLSDDEEEATVARAVQVALATVPGVLRRGMSVAYWRLEGHRLAGLLSQWLAVERERSTFVVVQREHDVTLELAQLQLKLRVDRIDELADGAQVIIDYKSGASSVQDWMGERPAKPQLLLYGIAAPDDVAALAFAQVRPADCRYVGVGKIAAASGISVDIVKAVAGKMDASDWQSLNASWRHILERIATNFVAGEAQVDPLTQASCTWCGLQPLCRINMADAALAGVAE